MNILLHQRNLFILKSLQVTFTSQIQSTQRKLLWGEQKNKPLTANRMQSHSFPLFPSFGCMKVREWDILHFEIWYYHHKKDELQQIDGKHFIITKWKTVNWSSFDVSDEKCYQIKWNSWKIRVCIKNDMKIYMNTMIFFFLKFSLSHFMLWFNVNMSFKKENDCEKILLCIV